FAALVDSPLMDGMEDLDISGNSLGTTVAEAISASSHVANLMHLNLSWGRIDDKGVQSLANSPRLARLVVLDLRLNLKIGDIGARALARSPHLMRLQSLLLSNQSRITESGKQALNDRFGKRTLHDWIYP